MRIERSPLDDGDGGYRETAPKATLIHRSGRPASRSFYADRPGEWWTGLFATSAITLALVGLFAYLAAHQTSPTAVFWVLSAIVLLVMPIPFGVFWLERPWRERPALKSARVRVDERSIRIGDDAEELVPTERVRDVGVVGARGAYRVVVVLDEDETLDVLDEVATQADAEAAAAVLRRYVRS